MLKIANAAHRNARSSRYGLGLGLIIACLDQLSKRYIEQWIAPMQAFELAPCLNIQLVYNTGAAFNLFADAGGWQRFVLIGLSALVVCWIVWQFYTRRITGHLAYLAFSFNLGGILGNLCDRIYYGVVADFIDFHIGHWHFAIFNLADTSIFIGASLWLLVSVRNT